MQALQPASGRRPAEAEERFRTSKTTLIHCSLPGTNRSPCMTTDFRRVVWMDPYRRYFAVPAGSHPKVVRHGNKAPLSPFILPVRLSAAVHQALTRLSP